MLAQIKVQITSRPTKILTRTQTGGETRLVRVIIVRCDHAFSGSNSRVTTVQKMTRSLRSDGILESIVAALMLIFLILLRLLLLRLYVLMQQILLILLRLVRLNDGLLPYSIST